MTPFCLLAFAHNFRPPSGAKGWAMTSFRPTIGRKMGDTPIAPNKPWFSPNSWASIKGDASTMIGRSTSAAVQINRNSCYYVLWRIDLIKIYLTSSGILYFSFKAYDITLQPEILTFLAYIWFDVDLVALFKIVYIYMLSYPWLWYWYLCLCWYCLDCENKRWLFCKCSSLFVLVLFVKREQTFCYSTNVRKNQQTQIILDPCWHTRCVRKIVTVMFVIYNISRTQWQFSLWLTFIKEK